MGKQYLWFAIIMLCLLVSACSTNVSERDSKKEQLKNTAEIKRRELQQVEGAYKGFLIFQPEVEQLTLLRLEIKDIPIQVEGQVDPVPTPTLTGYLRLVFSDDPNSNDFVSFSVKKADYDPKQTKLDMVVENQESQQIIITLQKQGEKLTGTFTAPSMSASGNVQLFKENR